MARDWFARALGALAIGLAALWIGTAAGAEPGGAESIPRGELEALVAKLKDESARAAFIADLEALVAAARARAPSAAETEPGARLLASVSERTRMAGEGVAEAAALLLDLPGAWQRVRAALESPTQRAFWLAVAWQVVLVIGIGLAAELAARWALAAPRRAVDGRANDALLVRFAFLVVRTLLDVLPIAAFAAAAYAAVPLVRPEQEARLVLLTLIYANVLARAINAVARMVLVPQAAGLRLFPLANETAAYLYIWAKRLANVTVYGYFAIAAARLLGLSPGVAGVALKLLGLLVAALALVFVFQNRRAVRELIRGDAERARLLALRQRLGDVWHILAALYIIGAFVVWVLEIEGGSVFLLRATVLTVLVLIAAAALMRGAVRLTRRLFAISAELTDQFPGIEQRANRYLPAVQAGLRFAIGAFAALVVLQAWGLDTLLWLSSEMGRRAFGSVFTIVGLVVGAVILWELLSSAIERYLGRLESEGADRDRMSRLKTLLPLARTAISITLAIIVLLIVLSEIGVNIAPLLASAGVVGLAIGFGAQTLVKDVITGLFILIEDAISVGDIAEVGGHAGIVEAISIRTIQLRDLEGRVYVIPFSEVATVINFTKGYSFAFMEIGVAYRENVDEVIAVLQALAEEMRAEEPWSTRILEPLEVFGLDRFGSSEIIVRIRFKTEPGQQFGVRREFYRRMKARFDELDIEIPFPHVTLYPGQDKAGGSPPLRLSLGPAAPESAGPELAPRADADAPPEELPAPGPTRG